MKKSYKKILISIFIFLIVILLIISYIVANNWEFNSIEENKEKIYYQIKYLDSEIIDMYYVLSSKNNWEELDRKLKQMYNYWNSSILDFNTIGIEKKYLTMYGQVLDNLSVNIKNQDIQSCINNLIEAYEFLVKYAEGLKYNGTHINIMYAKYNLLMAYSIGETGNWTLIYEYILTASENMLKVVNSMGVEEYSQYNINQVYVAIRELENLINVKDLELFYFKHNIAIEKIKNLSV